MADNSNNNTKVKQVRAKTTKKKATDEKESQPLIEESPILSEAILETMTEEVSASIPCSEDINILIEEEKKEILELLQLPSMELPCSVLLQLPSMELPCSVTEVITEVLLISSGSPQKEFEIKSLINLLILVTVRTDMQDKYDIKLNPELIGILTSIIKNNPDQFSTIEESFKNILKDGKIDSSDIPYLMELLSDIYKIIVNLKIDNDKSSPSELCGQIVKLIFNIMITEKFIVIENDVEMKKSFNALVDSSVMLITLSGYNGKIKSFFGCCF